MLPKGDAVLDSLKGAWDVTKTTGTNLFRKVPETFKAIGVRYVYPIEDRFDIQGAVQAVERIRPVHCNGVAFEPVLSEKIELRDVLVVGIKEYHKVYEFRVGMTPIKRYEEVVK
ncbi:hypothetical protein [Brevibacillus sp. MS2.2]|uniref:hypothetical protein n=1 Tax=Brevibacillus sp. MS2.2 TaxID=2738981 RepID=UPI0020C3038F|nr:hypothetical protein [Brevibacillus sp. MS2.2]